MGVARLLKGGSLVDIADDLDGECVAGIDGINQPPDLAASEHVAVVRPFARHARAARVAEIHAVAGSKVDPLPRGIVVRLVLADVADAVEMQDEAVRHIVVE